MASGKRPETSGQIRSDSLAARIGASTNALARSAFAQPSTVTDSIASLSDQGRKAESSSAAERGGQSTSHASPSDAVPRLDGISQTPTLEGFRSGISTSGATSAQAAFDEFTSPQEFETGIRTAFDDQHLNNSDRQSYRKTKLLHRNLLPEDESIRDKEPLALSKQEPGDVDGAAVVELLNDPAFTADNDPSHTWEPGEEDDTGVFDARNALNEANKMNQSRADTFDLIPEYEWKNLDSQPWHDILNRYHDEVWGDKLPLVQEARKELRQVVANGDKNSDDRPALRRLKMLLSHMKPPD